MESTLLETASEVVGLGASVAWVDGVPWAGAPGSGDVVVLEGGGHWWSEVEASYFGDRLAVFGDDLLSSAWEDGEGNGAVHLLTAGPEASVDDGTVRVVTVDNAVGMVLAAGPRPDAFLMGRPRAAGNAGVAEVRTSSGELDARWVGAATGALMGGALSAGDVDGDGLDDVVIGAWGDAGFHGAVYVFLSPVAGGELEDAHARWEGDDWALAGYSVAVGDTDGDGANEVVVGAFGDTRAGSGAGAITVVPASHPSGSLLDCDGHRLGPGIDAHLGASLALGDLDQDGRDDIVAGAPDRVDGGVAAIWYGPITGVAPTADATLTLNRPGDQLGSAVAIEPDAQGILVGAPSAGEGRGEVFLVAPSP